jgi:hypothetical protein
LNRRADRVKFMILRLQQITQAAQRNQQNQNETRHSLQQQQLQLKCLL